MRDTTYSARDSYTERSLSGLEADPAHHEVWTEEEEGLYVEEGLESMSPGMEHGSCWEEDWGEETMLERDFQEEFLRRRVEAGRSVPWLWGL